MWSVTLQLALVIAFISFCDVEAQCKDGAKEGKLGLVIRLYHTSNWDPNAKNYCSRFKQVIKVI